MNAIEVTNVRKSFGKLAVLKDVSLNVAQGEIFTLLGENGAGKSTLINILTTLSQADAGTVRIMSLDPQQAGNQIRQRISLNAQTMTLDENFSGRANLKLIAALRNLSAPKAAIEQLAQQLALSDFLDRKVATYSGGMRRRLDLAMSLLGDPNIVFLDEPTTGVDPKNRLALWALIRQMRTAGKTVFLTTQYLDEADALSDHIAFIHDGRIVKSGTPTAIKQQISDQYTLDVASSQQTQAQNVLDTAQLAYQLAGTTFQFTQDNAKQALTLLTQQDVTVQHFNLAETDLETVFLAVTAKEGANAVH